MDPILDLYDHQAEHAMISIGLHGRVAEFLALPPDSFTHWKADAIAKAMRTILAKGTPLDMPVVSRAILAAEGTGNRGQEICQALMGAYTMGVSGQAAPYYAERLTSLRVARSFQDSMRGFVERMSYAALNDEDLVAQQAIAELREAVDDAERSFHPAELSIMSAQDVMDLPVTEYDWLVPDLLERTDRLILTGMEGTGKSTLLAQFACTIGAGIHPFTGHPLRPRRYQTMIVDCENSPKQIQKRLRLITGQVDDLRKKHGLDPANWSECVRVVSRPEGFALTDPKEYARLDYMIEKVDPDLVVIGPLYKMSKLDYRDEQAAKEVCDTLDALRVRHQFALVTEAHMGHGDSTGARSSRPLGSSLFLRWPEFGFGLMPADGEPPGRPRVVDVRLWRGMREERNWPTMLQHGWELPWVPAGNYRPSEEPGA